MIQHYQHFRVFRTTRGTCDSPFGNLCTSAEDLLDLVEI